jgi:hypothetical protein
MGDKGQPNTVLLYLCGDCIIIQSTAGNDFTYILKKWNSLHIWQTIFKKIVKSCFHETFDEFCQLIWLIWFGIKYFDLKGQFHEIFDLPFLSPINPSWVTDYHPYIFLNSVSISPRYSRMKCRICAMPHSAESTNKFNSAVSWMKFVVKTLYAA